jgi:outer membrane protein
LAQRPDLQQLIKDVEKARLTRNYRHNQLFPSLDLVAGYGRRGASTVQTIPPQSAVASASEAFSEIASGSAPNETIGLVLSMPLTLTTERAQYRSSKQLQAQAELRVKQKGELIIREISDAFHTARSAKDRLEATRQSREYAQAALAAEEQKLAAGRSAVFFVLQLQSDLAQAQTTEKRAIADYQKALAQLYWADASLLERNHIAIVSP